MDEGAIVTALVPEPTPGKAKGDGAYKYFKSISQRIKSREDQGKLTELLIAIVTGLNSVPDGFVVENSEDDDEEGKPVEPEVAAVPNATGLEACVPKLGFDSDEAVPNVAAVDEVAPNPVGAGAIAVVVVVVVGGPAPNDNGTDGVAPKEKDEAVAAGRDDGSGATATVAGVEPKANEED